MHNFFVIRSVNTCLGKVLWFFVCNQIVFGRRVLWCAGGVGVEQRVSCTLLKNTRRNQSGFLGHSNCVTCVLPVSWKLEFLTWLQIVDHTQIPDVAIVAGTGWGV